MFTPTTTITIAKRILIAEIMVAFLWFFTQTETFKVAGGLSKKEQTHLPYTPAPLRSRSYRFQDGSKQCVQVREREHTISLVHSFPRKQKQP